MKLCQKCKKEIAPDNFIGRQAQCSSCGADLHCCLNCAFYDRSAYNNCLEPQAERVLDKSRFNFCDFFSFKLVQKKSGTADFSAKDKLEALFKKTLNHWYEPQSILPGIITYASSRYGGIIQLTDITSLRL